MILTANFEPNSEDQILKKGLLICIPRSAIS